MSNAYNTSLPKAKQLQRLGKAFKTPDHGQTLTRQSHKAECDINNIMKRYQKDGVITHFNKFGKNYGDATGNDFTEAMQIIAKGKSMFEELPSSARSRFDNDPAKFLDFVNDPENLDEMRELGLARGVPENPAPSQLNSPSTAATVNDPTAAVQPEGGSSEE